jgi:RNA polymerase sigma-70 factor (ECF subfamily)
MLRDVLLRRNGISFVISPEARGAWHELEARLRPHIARRVASNADVDDVLQEVFVRMHRSLGTLRDAERFGGWVYRIAERAIADNARSRARHPISASGSSDTCAEVDESAGHEAGHEAGQDLAPALTECIALFVARLPSAYRDAITLTELEGLTQKQAADMLGVSISGVKSRVQRGRAKIRAMFEECCEISLDRRGRVTQCVARPLDAVPEDCRAAATSWTARHRG